MNITQATWKEARRGTGISTCAGETAKNIFSQKYNSRLAVIFYLQKQRRGEWQEEGEWSVRALGKQGLSGDNAKKGGAQLL